MKVARTLKKVDHEKKSISDDADELFYISIALVFANSINVFARMSLHEFFCHKKRSLVLFQCFDLFHHDTDYFRFSVTQNLIINSFSKMHRSFLIIFDNRLKLSIFNTIYPFKKEQLRTKFNGNEQAKCANRVTFKGFCAAKGR